MSEHKELLRLPRDPDEGQALLIDGHAMAYRAYYAVRDLSAPDGRPVNAVYGFLRALLGLLREFPSRRVAVAFDAGGETFRHRLYADYKATRDPMPEALASQIPLIQSVVAAMGISVVAMRGVEADDILATLAGRLAEEGIDALIVSSDKDLAQLVGHRVCLLRPAGRGSGFTRMGRDEVVERFGVAPEQIGDWLALVGDSSDNIPGVPGVGAKTATRLLQEHGSLSALLEETDRVSNQRIKERLVEHAEDAQLARRLVALDHDVPIDAAPEGCRLRDPDVEKLTALLRELAFGSLLGELGLEDDEEGLAPPPQEEGNYETILTREALSEIAERIAGRELLSIDLETTSRDPMRAAIVGIALATEAGSAAYVPVAHDALGAPKQLPLEEVLDALRGAIEGETPALIGQNLKYDLLILRRYGLEPRGVAFDAMIASHLARPEQRQHNLELIARDVLGYQVQTYEQVAGKEGAFAAVPIEAATRYAAEDADIVFRLREPLLAAVERVGATKLFREVEMPLLSVLVRMEERGILVDPAELERQGVELRKQLEIAAADLSEMAGEPFNPGSPKQVAHILFEVLKLPVLDRTKTGPSTSARVLTELAASHPFPGKLMEYRELQKLLNTYIDRLPEAIHDTTGRIHTSFHQTATSTGRLSSSDPNLQNIPVRTEIGEKIRTAFVAPKGMLLIAADYSQIELRLLAHFSEDETLIDAFSKGQDLHRITASKMFGVPEASVDSRLRAAAKRINFGIVYGISPFGLSRQLGVPRDEARAYIDRFYRTYPKVKSYMEAAVETATERGYAETLLGRRRPLPNLRSRNVAARNFDRRNAVNTPIQGSAADLIKLAMLSIDRAIESGELAADMLLQIHDELLFETRRADVADVMAAVERMMKEVATLRLPLEVHLSSGPNWGKL